ncbi:potassium channel family protein [Natronoarchaeum sp. GCM10025703]|uniref:potassium channel family protein n=1 Tax=unclassified Natronoarchaeum TaxID=2620183 RepID=UPI00361102A9
MSRVRRRAAYYLLSIASLIIVFSVAYDVAMKTFEPGPYPPAGTDLSLLHSMQVVVETFTATGYGSDSPWQSAELNLLIMVLDLTGVALFFLALPAVFVPLFQDALSPSAPTELEEAMHDHVIICSDTTRAESLIEELESKGIEYVVVEPNRERAVEYRENGHTAIQGDPESIEDLQAVDIADARALVADGADRIDASIVLAAKEANPDVETISVVEDSTLAKYHRLAGAGDVLTPRAALGEGLARKLTTTVSTDLGDSLRLGEDIEIAELPVHEGSDLAGQTLGESGLRERYGVNVIGTWLRGDFETPPSLDTPMERGTTLLVTGTESQLDRLRRETVGTVRGLRRGETIIIGYGEVGQTVATALEEAGVPYVTVDETEKDGVDIVGDATDPEILREAGIERANSVVLALPDDTTTEFTTLVIRDLNDSIEIVARAQQQRAVQKTYRAGADHVLSLATVSGRSIATRVVDDEEVLNVGSSVELVRTTAPKLSGKSLQSADVRERTGCTVVAIERDGEVLTDLDADTEFIPDDEIVVAGTDQGTNYFIEQYG